MMSLSCLVRFSLQLCCSGPEWRPKVLMHDMPFSECSIQLPLNTYLLGLRISLQPWCSIHPGCRRQGLPYTYWASGRLDFQPLQYKFSGSIMVWWLNSIIHEIISLLWCGSCCTDHYALIFIFFTSYIIQLLFSCNRTLFSLLTDLLF